MSIIDQRRIWQIREEFGKSDCLQPRVCSGFWANVGRMRLLGLTGWELSPFYSKHYFILCLIVLKPFSIGGRSSPFFIQNIYFIIFDMI
jgi:hypothetical protein